MRVALNLARSMQTQEPISTSSSTITGADLRDLGVLGAVPAVAEAVAAQDAAGVDGDAVADGQPLAQDDVGKDLAVVAEDGVVADVDAGVEDRPAADADPLADEDVGADGDAFAKHGRRGHAGGGIDARRRARHRRGEQLQHLGHRQVGVVHHQHGGRQAGGQADRLVSDHARRPGSLPTP